MGADNDAFNFWIPPWDRTDREYTSGVRGALHYPGPSPLLRFPAFRRAVCAADAAPCASHSYAIGQAIYTGEAGWGNLRRPNAGWLFLEAAERDSTDDVVHEMALAVGVVGPPALGEPVQQLFHALGPHYQRPMDWSRQLPFEPGVVARLARTRRVSRAGSGRWSGQLNARAGAALGTILTSATLGAAAIGGVQLGGYPEYTWWWPRLELGADLRGHAVARDEFIDGTFFRSSDRMRRVPFHDERRLFAALHWERVTAVYRVNTVGVQYHGQPGASVWSSLELEWRPGR